MADYSAYAVKIRNQLHMYPEIGYDLPGTLALIRGELTRFGIEFTEQYGRSSIVAVINPEKSGFTIGIRADMDALPIQEKSDKPHASRIPGAMHACGHDVHTAIALAVARQLQDRKEELSCRVKILFTPAEEFAPPGCKLMAEDGVMDDIDCVVSCHVDPAFPAGTVAVDAGGQGANSMGFTLEFYGSSAHAAMQHKGNDAIAMAVQAYQALEVMIAKETDPMEPCLLNIGAFNGGITNNVICNYCKLYGTLRTQNDETNAYLTGRIRQIAEGIAAAQNGRAEFTEMKFLPYVVNDATVTERMALSAEALLGKDKVLHKKRTMGGEDFSYLCRQKPGMMFRLGICGGPETGYALHTDTFDVDERCFGVGIDLFVRFVLDNMQGIFWPEKA